MRIAILTSGRFWLLDLARELSALGHDVRFYSLLPRFKTRAFGLPDACNHWLGPWVAPLLGASRAAARTPLQQATDQALRTGLDIVASKLIAPCDVLIGLSGLSLHTAEALRRRGARIHIERGSRHILSQRSILEALYPGRDFVRDPVVTKWTVYRELAEYGLADTVVVPSIPVARSFKEYGFDPSRLFRNPYGVGLEMFPPTPSPEATRTIIMVGAFSLRKGCDVLVEAVHQMRGVKLLHVGSPGDCPFPRASWFETVGAVPQAELTRYYAMASVAALASREEGLALVQAQAIASGLPLVCTDRTGGEDLRQFVHDPADIAVVPPDDPISLRLALESALERTSSRSEALRDRIGPDQRRALSWQGYGARYDAFLTRGERPNSLEASVDRT